jgi:hypothetical protein
MGRRSLLGYVELVKSDLRPVGGTGFYGYTVRTGKINYAQLSQASAIPPP